MKTDQPKPAPQVFAGSTIVPPANQDEATPTGEWTETRVMKYFGITVSPNEAWKLAQEINAALAAERDLLYRIGRRMMESQATGEPLNLDLLRREIDEVLYPAQKPERFA